VSDPTKPGPTPDGAAKLLTRTGHMDACGLHLFTLAAACFLAAGGTGVLTALASTASDAWLLLPLQNLRPMHTLFSIAGAIAGMLAMTEAVIGKAHPGRGAQGAGATLALISLFVVGAALSIALGYGSGREYVSWHPAASVPLLAAMAASAIGIFRVRSGLFRFAPEGGWLIGTGYAFVMLGLVESHLWLWPWVGLDSVRDLTVQWHGIDLLFAGMNVALYGAAAALVSQRQPTPRRSSLYAIALFSLLFTFGHHHYASPQPGFLKTLAVVASLLAIVSFLRHARAARRGEAHGNAPIWQAPIRAAALWTLVATGSGILLAIPQVNTLYHGTYTIVIHAMGSMIGALFMLVIAGSLVVAGRFADGQRIRLGVRLVNGSLAALWVYLLALGTFEGLARVGADPLLVSQQLRPWMAGFALLGAVLLAGISLLCLELIRVTQRASRWVLPGAPCARSWAVAAGAVTARDQDGQ